MVKCMRVGMQRQVRCRSHGGSQGASRDSGGILRMGRGVCVGLSEPAEFWFMCSDYFT
jgi:hypothetical protein